MMNETELPSVHQTNYLGNEFISELNKLSLQERDEAVHDVHGVSDIMNETAAFIACSIKLLEYELSIIPDKDKEAYLLALHQNSDYVMNKKFQLMFLRALEFDVKAAAARVVSFFQEKRTLFGQDKLGRDIRVDDLDEDDIACLESGYAQVLGVRDRADRAIFMLMPMIRQFRTLENKMRAIYMVLMFALKDVETQKRGIVAIPYNIGQGRTNDRQAVFKNAQLLAALPLRFTAVHYCYDDEKLRPIFFLAMYALEKAARIRTRFHLGTDMEVIYTLMTFGLPSESLPVSFNGALRLEGHRDFVRKIRKIDDLNGKTSHIIVPGKYDVLLGRGKPLQKCSGNLNYHYVIECYRDRYEAAAKGGKAEVAKEIVRNIQIQGGHFLKLNDAHWIAISDEAAKSKVSHTFRNRRIAARAALKKAAATAGAPNEYDIAPKSCENSILISNENTTLHPVKQKKRKSKDLII